MLWSGNKLPSLKPSCRLRQGDPLSPYLFVLWMEKLALLIDDQVRNGSWNPVKISREGPVISHLFFADDILLFTKASHSQVQLVTKVMEDFCNSSGLKVNLEKSRAMCSPRIPRTRKNQLASSSPIQFIGNLGRYLGFRLKHGRMKKDDLNFILEKIQTWLSSWKGRLLNKAGRVTLAKSVLASIPVYSMQTAWIPTGTCMAIDSMVRSFVWKSNAEGKGLHLVNWKKKTCPRQNGGLGVREARLANTSLLGKLVWELLHPSNKLWVKALAHKYMGNKSIFNCKPKPSDSFI